MPSFWQLSKSIYWKNVVVYRTTNTIQSYKLSRLLSRLILYLLLLIRRRHSVCYIIHRVLYCGDHSIRISLFIQKHPLRFHSNHNSNNSGPSSQNPRLSCFPPQPLAARRGSNSSVFVFNGPSSIISPWPTCTGRLILHVFRLDFPEAQKLQSQTSNSKK